MLPTTHLWHATLACRLLCVCVVKADKCNQHQVLSGRAGVRALLKCCSGGSVRHVASKQSHKQKYECLATAAMLQSLVRTDARHVKSSENLTMKYL